MGHFQGIGKIVDNGEENKYRLFRHVGLLSTIPVVLLSGPVIGYFIGIYLDKRWGTAPWLMIFFLIIGFIASVRQTIAVITKAGSNSK